MIILIGGETHTGKTLMAQKLLEKYKIPYTSIDHIKMGLFRGFSNCGFAPDDNDNVISEKIWGIIKGIIDTCRENNQNIILEGCYLLHEKIKNILCDDIIAFYLVFSESYIYNNFDKIVKFENVIENRKYSDSINIKNYIRNNFEIKNKCIKFNIPYFEIDSDYKKDIEIAYDYIDNMLPVKMNFNEVDFHDN